MLRIAHLSDPHVLSPAGAEWRHMLFNKRITGYANLVLRRARVHRREYLEAVLAGAKQLADHVVVTGDITNLALESEYHEALALLGDLARSVEVTVVPGNHDVYVPAIFHEHRFPHHFGAFLKSDLPELALDLPAGPFPCVKLRGGVALIALSSGVPRPPFIAAGFLGERQLEGLQRVLEHPEVARRTAVILLHHPPVDSRPRAAQLRDGLVDGEDLRRVLDVLRRGMVLYGHLHVRGRGELQTSAGTLELACASGAALDHANPAIRAGLNLYEFDDDGGLVNVEAHVLDGAGQRLERVSLSHA